MEFLAFEGTFAQVAAVLVVAVVIGAIAVLLRQPLIISFLATGILVGPAALGIVGDNEAITLLAEIGIALLLFVVGLRLDLRLIRSVGPVALATGLGQVAFTAIIGFGLGLALGLGTTAAAYTSVALTFSSTIIIVKLLSDKKELDELHGRIAVGFLIVQDILVVLAIILLSAFAGDGGITGPVLRVVGIGAAILVVMALLMRYVMTPLFHRLAHSAELLVLAAITWALAAGAITAWLGFSLEVGAFLAGVSLASTPFRDALSSRMVPLRDFLLLFFFITLGVSVELTLIGDQIVPAVVLSLFVLIGNPIIVLVIMGAMGYRRRVSFKAGLTVAQISEFSFILAALGLSLGQITEQTVGLITAVGLITIGLSTYLILYSQQIYERLRPALGIFERKSPDAGPVIDEGYQPDVLVFGLGRYGAAVAQELDRCGVAVLGVDFDPRALEHAEAAGIPTAYGDAEDPELPELLPIRSARVVVSTVRQYESELMLLHALRRHGFEGMACLTAASEAEADQLRERGADHVLRPFADAASSAAARVLEGLERLPGR